MFSIIRALDEVEPRERGRLGDVLRDLGLGIRVQGRLSMRGRHRFDVDPELGCSRRRASVLGRLVQHGPILVVEQVADDLEQRQSNKRPGDGPGTQLAVDRGFKADPKNKILK